LLTIRFAELGGDILSGVYKTVGSPEQVFGISTNVAGWNSRSKQPVEFEGTSDAQYNKCQDEKSYVDTICPLITADGMPCHAIVDTGRNAVQGLRLEWGDWCNVNGACFGVRPTSTTGDSLDDAFVWVKPGGESDRTSDSSVPVMTLFAVKRILSLFSHYIAWIIG
jgi:cellulose 1,4-beta-cellobiosidase